MTRAESKMTDAERRLRIAMLDQKISRQQLAQELGLKVTTMGNIIRGGRCSAATKRRITQRLKCQIWQDTPYERILVFGPNLEIEHPTEQAAKEFADEFGHEFSTDAVFRRGNVVGFKKKFLAVIRDDQPSPAAETPDQSARNRSISGCSIE